MMGCTDRHCRVLLRLISPHSFLFTEMIVSGALIHGHAAHFLQHGDDGPCALQIGGSDPKELQTCAVLAEQAGYQEVNLNVGCPSDRVQVGRIGACLMAEPELVAECLFAMQSKVRIPVTIKCRIGIDDTDSYDSFRQFVKIVSGSGCRIFYVHARKAILQGLSPKENREIPPLKYDYVEQIAREMPDCEFFLNGGIRTVTETVAHLDKFEGVMLGRAPYNNPYMLAEIEKLVFNHDSLSRLEIIDQYVEYASVCVADGDHPKHLLKHLLGLFTGCPGARQFRRYLSEHMFEQATTMPIIYDALDVSGLNSNQHLATNQQQDARC
jgi:tRNA-dihydrouridine synthase A